MINFGQGRVKPAARVDVQLAEHAREVPFDGAGAEEEPRADLSVREQGGLADSGLAAEHENATLAGLALRQECVERSALRCSPAEHRSAWTRGANDTPGFAGGPLR